MENEIFGSVMYNGKMINLDKENIENLEKISQDLKIECETLKAKMITVFKQ